jgi:flagellar hook protein FlgE
MAGDISTIQSLKAVDAWIDVINANINGGVRTAFKASRLRFAGSNTNVDRAGTSTSLPLQFPESGLTTANTIIDFSQGAIVASTAVAHLAIQGAGFFLLLDPGTVSAVGNSSGFTSNTRMYLTRDGEFRTNSQGFLVNAHGYVLVTSNLIGTGPFNPAVGASFYAVYNDLELTAPGPNRAVKLSDFLTGTAAAGKVFADNVSVIGSTTTATVKVTMGAQNLRYSTFGSTVFDFGLQATGTYDPALAILRGDPSETTVLSKSLEASNASMTQSVPELSLAQKLFSALTKVLQTKQTNVDGVLNLVR